MNGRLVLLGSCLLLALTGCTAQAGGAAPAADERVLRDTVPGERMTGTELCELVPAKAVTNLLAAQIAETTSKEWASARKTSATCEHQGVDPRLLLSFHVTVELSRAPATDRVEETFTHPHNGNRVEYERVDGLGDAAGFGRDPMIPDLSVLDVVTEHEDARRNVSVYVQGRKPTLEQLRPIVERVLQELRG